MKAKVIYLAGVPASGKTTIFNKIRIAYFQGGKEFKHGLARGIQSRDARFFMLGVYDGSAFEGTDKLSMAVINDAIDFCQKQETQCVVFVEGDRLFNYRFLKESQAVLLLIDANERVLAQRHIDRGDEQTERFLRSRRSKVENFIAKYHVQRLWNNTTEDMTRILDYLTKEAECYVKDKD
jgi:dephospho-CoA kinase